MSSIALVDKIESGEVWIFKEPMSRENVLRTMCDHLVQDSIVAENFYDQLMVREKEYPTGLRTSSGIHVALPHTDPLFVYKTSLSVATLSEPVVFREMGSPDKEVDVRVIFLLTYTSPDMHLPILGEVASLIQNPDFLSTLSACSTKDQVIRLFREYSSTNA